MCKTSALKIQTIAERNLNRPKPMERYTMFVKWKIDYYYDVCSPQIGLQIQCNPKQNPSWIFLQQLAIRLTFILQGKVPCFKENILKNTQG